MTLLLLQSEGPMIDKLHDVLMRQSLMNANFFLNGVGELMRLPLLFTFLQPVHLNGILLGLAAGPIHITTITLGAYEKEPCPIFSASSYCLLLLTENTFFGG